MMMTTTVKDPSVSSNKELISSQTLIIISLTTLSITTSVDY